MDRVTPDGSLLQILGDPPAEPVLQLTRHPKAGTSRETGLCVLRAEDRAWLRAQLARFDPTGPVTGEASFGDPQLTMGKLARMTPVLQKLAAIADAFDRSELDEARPDWEGAGDGSNPETVVLLSGRGGKTLLTLADAFAARAALNGATPPAPRAEQPTEQPEWRALVVDALWKVMLALDAQGARMEVEGARMDQAREAVAALTATTPAPPKPNPATRTLLDNLKDAAALLREMRRRIAERGCIDILNLFTAVADDRGTAKVARDLAEATLTVASTKYDLEHQAGERPWTTTEQLKVLDMAIARCGV